MKKMVLIVSLITLVAFVAVAMAQQKPAPAKPATTVAPAAAPAPAPAPEKPKAEKPKAAKMEKFAGTVEKVDEMAKTFVVKGKKDTMTFALGDKTKITKAGKDMPFAELKMAMDISVEYMKEGDKMVAGSIRVAAPKAAPKAKATEKPAEKKPADAPKK